METAEQLHTSCDSINNDEEETNLKGSLLVPKDVWKKSAVLRLMALYKENDKTLRDKSKNIKKKEVWNRIAQCLKTEGLCDFDGDKCSQKWRNILHDYATYDQHRKTTELKQKDPDSSEKHRDPPWFFRNLASILRDDSGGHDSVTMEESLRVSSKFCWDRPSVLRLIGLYRENELKMKEKKSKKKEVWNGIARCLQSEGLCDYGGSKCSQKWRNLLHEYLSYNLHRKETTELGENNREPPWFFNDMDLLLHDRYHDFDRDKGSFTFIGVINKRKADPNIDVSSDEDLAETAKQVDIRKGRTGAKRSMISALLRDAVTYKKAEDQKLREQLERHHNEKMDLLKNFLDVFTKT